MAMISKRPERMKIMPATKKNAMAVAPEISWSEHTTGMSAASTPQATAVNMVLDPGISLSR